MRSILLLFLLTLPCLAQEEQVPKNIGGNIGQTSSFVQGSFLSVAEAMPEAKYSFVPTTGEFKGARTFGEQVKHVACANFAFFNQVEGKKPPDLCEKGGPDPAKTKTELLKYLGDSFDYSNRVLATIGAKNALDRVDGRYAGPNTWLVTAV